MPTVWVQWAVRIRSPVMLIVLVITDTLVWALPQPHRLVRLLLDLYTARLMVLGFLFMVVVLFFTTEPQITQEAGVLRQVMA